MSETVDPAIVDAINETQRATLDRQVILTTSGGKATQAVAVSAAIAIQDAVDGLRHTGTLAASASGVALAQFLSTGDPRYLEGLSQIQEMVAKATQNAAAVGAAMAALVKEFPSG